MTFLKVFFCVFLTFALSKCDYEFPKVETVSVEVPETAYVNWQATLKCDTNLIKSVASYFVLWYKDNELIYTYERHGRNAQKIIPAKGVHVVGIDSDEKELTIENISLDTAGTYKCVVVEEGPNPARKSDEKVLKVEVDNTPRNDCRKQGHNHDWTLRCYMSTEDANSADGNWDFKWYNNGKLFYYYREASRYGETFDVEGIEVDSRLSFQNDIHLKVADLKNPGVFTNELIHHPPGLVGEPKSYNLTVTKGKMIRTL